MILSGESGPTSPTPPKPRPYLIERISGRPLRDYVKEKVLVPLGMNDTDWFHPPKARSRFVKPYRSVNGELEPGPSLYGEGATSEEQTYAEGAIGLNGPIEDHAKSCQMLLNKEEFNSLRIMKLDTVERMTTIDRLPENGGAGAGFQFGLGFELHRVKKPSPSASDSAFSWGGMFGTQYMIDPAHHLAVLKFASTVFGQGLSDRGGFEREKAGGREKRGDSRRS